MHPMRKNARVLFASLVGTAVEYYDFFIYGTAAALVFGPLFFPSESEAAQTLLALMSFGLAFVARPVGAVVFGHYGDRIGRKATLVVSLMIMGISTLLIAFLPTYAMVGWVAPLLLCILRFMQGFGLAGEWAGAALLAAEYAPPGWRARFVAAMQMGTPIGFFLATVVFMVLALALTDAQFMAWGWRIPFVVSSVLVILGLWVRLNIAETPEFKASLEQERPHRVPFVPLFREHWGSLLAGSAGVIGTFATFYLCTAFALAYATGPLGYERDTFLAIQLFANFFYAGGMIVAGINSDRFAPEKVLLIGATMIAVVGLAFGSGLQGGLPFATITLCALMLALGLANGPLGAWMSHLFPVPVRYSGVSISFNTGGLIGGAFVPVAAQMMVAAGYPLWVGAVLAVAGLITLFGVIFSRRYED